ncbi:MAG: hypothetical protein GF310_10050 [candidate division Zixibacteria bacterium]|nr:hypothetical protein [candidate division Zixibacteria bacterium]
MKRIMENIPYEEKANYATHILDILVTNGSQNLSEDQNADYKNRLLAIINNNI